MDFLEKPFDDEALLASVRSALNQLDQDQKRQAARSDVEARLASLSNRERDVLQGLVAGHANKQIAYDLGISPRTIEIYRANLMMRAASDTESSGPTETTGDVITSLAFIVIPHSHAGWPVSCSRGRARR